LHRFIVIILLSCIHAQPSVNVFVWLDYIVNNEYIKEVLCINKEAPKLKCDGKCYLMQQLKKNEIPQGDKKLPIPLITKIEYIEFAQESIDYNTAVLSYSKKQSDFYYLLRISKGKIEEIFHPPQV